MNKEPDRINELLRKESYTYRFHYYDGSMKAFLPFYDLFDPETTELIEGERDREFFERELYMPPEDPPYEEFRKRRSNLLEFLNVYFKEVFGPKMPPNGFIKHQYFNLILPKSVDNEIVACIERFGLKSVEDLIYEIISIAQSIRIEDVEYWADADNQKLITTAEKASNNMIRVLEKHIASGALGKRGKKPAPPLKYISFVFGDEAVKVEHRYLTYEILEALKEYFDRLPNKSWREDLEAYPNTFEKNYQKNQFKYTFAKALYDFFTQTQLIVVDEAKPFPNHLMRCITMILEFCLIPISGPDELEEVKIKTVRNWLSRS